MRGALGCLTVIEVLLALIAIPIGAVLVVLGDSEGWWGVLAGTILLVGFGVQLWRNPQKMPGPM